MRSSRGNEAIGMCLTCPELPPQHNIVGRSSDGDHRGNQYFAIVIGHLGRLVVEHVSIRHPRLHDWSITEHTSRSSATSSAIDAIERVTPRAGSGGSAGSGTAVATGRHVAAAAAAARGGRSRGVVAAHPTVWALVAHVRE